MVNHAGQETIIYVLPNKSPKTVCVWRSFILVGKVSLYAYQAKQELTGRQGCHYEVLKVNMFGRAMTLFVIGKPYCKIYGTYRSS
jgi:hypothetical protein